MLELQLFLTILKGCQSFCPVHFWRFVWNHVKFGFSYLLFLVVLMQKIEYQNICNCNNFLGEVVHYLTEVQGCQYFCP